MCTQTHLVTTNVWSVRYKQPRAIYNFFASTPNRTHMDTIEFYFQKPCHRLSSVDRFLW